MLKVVREWFWKEGHQLEDLYKGVSVEFVEDVLSRSREEDLSRWGEQQKLEETEFIGKLATEVMENIENIQLREKAPFHLESLISSLSHCITNSRMVDSFSQSVLILAKSSIMKGKPLASMQIARLLHSLNKEEAAG